MADWVADNYDMTAFRSFDELIDKVKTDFKIDGIQWQDQFEPYIREEYSQVFTLQQLETDPAYRRQQRELADKQLAAELLGNGEVYRGYSDDIVAEFNKPEILGIDFSQFSTRREDIEPPKITRFEPIKEPWLTGSSRYVKGGLEKVVGIKRKERSSKFEERPPIRDEGLIGKFKRLFRR